MYKKLNKAIDHIKKSKLKKEGYNAFSKYKYFTPDQIDLLVYLATKELGLFVKFDLIRNELGITGKATIIDIENKEEITFVMASGIPEIKATNISQQLGGAMTYTKRYMMMNIFAITDNNLDFDTDQKKDKSINKEDKPNKKEEIIKVVRKELPWLNFKTEQYTKSVDWLKNHTLEELKKYYRISKEVELTLI